MVSVSARVLRTLLLLSLVVFAPPLLAQQTGSISGKVTTTDGSLLPGRDRRGSLRRPARAPGDGDGRPRASTGCPPCPRAATR